MSTAKDENAEISHNSTSLVTLDFSLNLFRERENHTNKNEIEVDDQKERAQSGTSNFIIKKRHLANVQIKQKVP